MIGQLIDYASALHGTACDNFAAPFAKRNKSVALEVAVEAAAGAPLDAAAFRENVSTRLRLGQLRLVVAVDEIHDDLRRAVEFLNENSTDNVVSFALEIGYFKQGSFEILVPRTFGHEVEVAGTINTRWTAEEVEQAVAELPSSPTPAHCDGLARPR